jgi:hypothetical protein
MGSCESCIHYRLTTPPDPLQGIRLVSKKMIELRTKWQQELANRAQLEEQRLDAGLPFDFEPWAYPYCAHYSEVESQTNGDPTWVLCAVANPNDECDEFTQGSAT